MTQSRSQTLTAISLCLMGFAFVILAACNQTRSQIGYVEVQTVFEQSNRGKEQIANFKKDLVGRSDEIKELKAQGEALQAEIQKLAASGNRAAAEQKLPALQQIQQKFLAAQQDVRAAMMKEQSEVDKSFMDQLRAVMDEVRKEEGLAAIQAYDKNKTLSFDPKLDMTQKALARYNQKYPSEASKDKTPKQPVN